MWVYGYDVDVTEYGQNLGMSKKLVALCLWVYVVQLADLQAAIAQSV
jgi:hypothetical protein